MAIKNLEVELDRGDLKVPGDLEEKLLEGASDLSIEDLKELYDIKAYAFKTKEGEKDRDYMKDKYSCGWSVCHCATYYQ